MSRPKPAILPIACAAFALSGCGLEGGGNAPEGSVQKLFADNCSVCHTLDAAGSSGSAGPNLDDARPSRRRVLDILTMGAAGMPSYDGRLTRAEIEKLSIYVSRNAGR